MLLLTVWLAGVAHAAAPPETWVGTWAAAPQPPLPGTEEHYLAQTLRLIVHVSAGGSRVRIHLSNLYGNTPITIGAAHIAQRTHNDEIDPHSDRALTFGSRASIVIPAHATVLSDPVDLSVPALSDVSVSFYLPEKTTTSTVHVLAQQTSYVSPHGDATGATHLAGAKPIGMWPFLTGVDVLMPSSSYAVVAFGDSTVDGDGSTADANQRWPDALAARLHHAGQHVAVLNVGMIGNRLLYASPSASPFGLALGEAGIARFKRDVLQQAGAKVVIVRMGSNDLGFMHGLAPSSESVDADALIAGYRQLIAAAHEHGLAVVGSTIPPFEGVDVIAGYATPQKNAIRRQVNTWVRQSGAFDAVLDVDRTLRDPNHPARLLPAYDSGDHLHPNDSGYRAVAASIPLETLAALASRPAGAVSSMASSAHAVK